MQQLDGKQALVTGAYRGIGQAIAKQYARKGVFLVLGGRNTDKLTDTARACEAKGATTHVFPIDIADTDSLSDKIAYVSHGFKP